MTHREIVGATERLLAERRARDINVEDIVAAAGVSKATFYNYFESKWAVVAYLARSVLQGVYQRIEPFAGSIDGQALSWVETLRASLAEGCRLWAENHAVMRAAHENWHEVPELSNLWLGLSEQFQLVVTAAIEREREAGRARAGVPAREVASTLVWSTAYCLYMASLAEIRLPLNEQQLCDSLTEMWRRTIYRDDGL